jgi:antitoxin component YwqK of YwqJK toxin-antitoxin module
MLRLPALCVVCAAGLWAGLVPALAAEKEQEPNAERIRAEAKHLPFLRDHPQVREMLKELPHGHRIKPDVRLHWSDDLQKRVPHLLSLTPIGPDGKPDGQARYFGDGLRIVPYKRGAKHGVEKWYSPPRGRNRKRSLVAETPWEDGKIYGVKKVYHRDNGKLRMEIPYEAGLRQGVARTYDLPGHLLKTTPYKDGRIEGKVIEFYPGARQQRKVIPFRGGKVHGLVREYYEDGAIKREIAARNDLFHGVERQFDEAGNLVRQRYWLDDEIVSREEHLRAIERKEK